MRERKYRAWDKEEKRMLYSGFHDRNWYATPYNDAKGCHCVKAKRPRDAYHMIIMDYIGLTDENGREIHEKDRVKCVWSGNYKHEYIFGIVQMVDGCWDVVFNESQYDAFLKCNVPRRYVKCFTINHGLEIIGNIYENPELLEE